MTGPLQAPSIKSAGTSPLQTGFQLASGQDIGDAILQGGPARLVRAIFRLHASKAFSVDVGRGLQPQAFGRIGDSFDAPLSAFSGDIEIRGLGWLRGTDQPLWRIEQAAPLPCTLLSAITEIKGAD